MADIATFIMLSAAANLGAQPDDAHANLQSWLARVGAGPSVAQELQGMQQALARALSADS